MRAPGQGVEDFNDLSIYRHLHAGGPSYLRETGLSAGPGVRPGPRSHRLPAGPVIRHGGPPCPPVKSFGGVDRYQINLPRFLLTTLSGGHGGPPYLRFSQNISGTSHQESVPNRFFVLPDDMQNSKLGCDTGLLSKSYFSAEARLAVPKTQAEACGYILLPL
jgi:hypothetical protein